jgi:restriction system protein
MFYDDLKSVAWGLIIISILVSISIENPIFGILLVVLIISLSIWLFYLDDNKEIQNNNEIIKKIEEKENKAKQKLIDKLPKEFQTIIEKDFKVVSAAYRKSVTRNAFGKKNYDKFAPQLEEYIQDHSKILMRLDEEFETNVEFNIDGIIDFIEKKLDETESAFNYSDDMDPYDYEYLCAEEFNKNQWDAKATQGSSDQGVDVIAKKDGKTLVAQCKRFAKPVGNKAVQEVVAGMKYYEATEGVVIAPNGFTNSAINLAKANNIKLIHHTEINTL